MVDRLAGADEEADGLFADLVAIAQADVRAVRVGIGVLRETGIGSSRNRIAVQRQELFRRSGPWSVSEKKMGERKMKGLGCAAVHGSDGGDNAGNIAAGIEGQGSGHRVFFFRRRSHGNAELQVPHALIVLVMPVGKPIRIADRLAAGLADAAVGIGLGGRDVSAGNALTVWSAESCTITRPRATASTVR